MPLLADLLHFAVSLSGFLVSALVVVWLLCWGLVLIGVWPAKDRGRGPQDRLRGGPAKHDWQGVRWP